MDHGETPRHGTLWYDPLARTAPPPRTPCWARRAWWWSCLALALGVLVFVVLHVVPAAGAAGGCGGG